MEHSNAVCICRLTASEQAPDHSFKKVYKRVGRNVFEWEKDTSWIRWWAFRFSSFFDGTWWSSFSLNLLLTDSLISLGVEGNICELDMHTCHLFIYTGRRHHKDLSFRVPQCMVIGTMQRFLYNHHHWSPLMLHFESLQRSHQTFQWLQDCAFGAGTRQAWMSMPKNPGPMAQSSKTLPEEPRWDAQLSWDETIFTAWANGRNYSHWSLQHKHWKLTFFFCEIPQM